MLWAKKLIIVSKVYHLGYVPYKIEKPKGEEFLYEFARQLSSNHPRNILVNKMAAASLLMYTYMTAVTSLANDLLQQQPRSKGLSSSHPRW